MRANISGCVRLVVLMCCCLTIGSAIAADEFALEPGFKPIFNDKDLTGWQTKKGESLDGKTESPDKRFKVADGMLVIDATVKGDVIIQTSQQFAGDAHVKFDFLPGPKCNNDLFFRGVKFDIKPQDVKNLQEGKWNQFEIIVSGDTAEFKCNGETQRTAPAKAAPSPLGLRAEIGPIQYRHLRAK
jgi:hypothetical protein